MAINGNYDVTVSMPEGDRSLTINLKADGDSLSGNIDGTLGKHDFSGGRVSGNEASWTVLLHQQPKETEHGKKDESGGGFFRKLGKFVSESLSEPLMDTTDDTPKTGSSSVLAIDFKATVSGDEISGEMAFGDYATGSFKGRRTAG